MAICTWAMRLHFWTSPSLHIGKKGKYDEQQCYNNAQSLNPAVVMDNLTKEQMSSAILSKFCAVDVLVGLVNLFALRNIEVSANQGVICTSLYRQAVRTMHACWSG